MVWLYVRICSALHFSSARSSFLYGRNQNGCSVFLTDFSDSLTTLMHRMMICYALVFLLVDGTFLTANLQKVAYGTFLDCLDLCFFD